MRAVQVASQFSVPGQVVSVRPFGSGNVNDTYLAIFRTTFSESRFILQRIRKTVFPEPKNIMLNMRVITDHCHAKLAEESASTDRIWQLPKIIEARAGGDFVLDDDGELWRAISHIASASAPEVVQNATHACEVGVVLGHFQRLISDIPVERLVYTLPGFHVAPGYLAKLDVAATAPLGRERLGSAGARECMEFIQSRRHQCAVLQDAIDSHVLQLRPTHGDPKVGNVMIDDETGKGTCIIDLDTVQPGLIHYDIGDCMRSCCNPAGEDARDLSAVHFDTDIFSKIFRGYMAEARSFISDADRAYFFDAIHLLPLELGIRFFADYLAGDVYFKTRHPGHNLHRALVQLKLAASIEAGEAEIRRVLGAL